MEKLLNKIDQLLVHFELLNEIDELLAHFEDFTHGKDGDDITNMRCKIAKALRQYNVSRVENNAIGVENLLMNMGAGLLPENLTQREIEMLEIKYGTDWFEKLGYKEPKYKKPKKIS